MQSIEGSTAASLGAVEDGAGSGVPPAELSEPNIDFEFYEKFVSKSNRRGTTGKKRYSLSFSIHVLLYIYMPYVDFILTSVSTNHIYHC